MSKLNNCTEYVVATAIIAIVCGGKLFGVLPFGEPFYIALTVFAMPKRLKKTSERLVFFVLCSVVIIVCPLLFTFELWRLYGSVLVVGIIVVQKVLSLKTAKMRRKWVEWVFAIVALIVRAVIENVFRTGAVAILNCVLSIAFLYFAINAASVAMEKFSRKPSTAERVSLCVTLAVFGLCLGRLRIGNYYVGIAFLALLILALSVAGVRAELAGGIAIALGVCVCDLNLGICLLAVSGSVAAFSALPRVCRVAMGAVVLACGLVLCGTSVYVVGLDTAFYCLGGLIFALAPQKKLTALSEYFDYDGRARLAVRHYMNKVKLDAGNRLYVLGGVFDETSRLMSDCVESGVDVNADVMRDKICSRCVKRDRCNEKNAKKAFDDIARTITEGRTVLTSLPDFFANDCVRMDEVLHTSSSMSDSVKARIEVQKNERKARELVVERLSAIATVLNEAGRAEAQPVSFDCETERAFILEASARGVECADAFVRASEIIAVVRTGTLDEKSICLAAKSCLKGQFEVRSNEKTTATGWSVVTLKRKPKYEAVYARVGVSRDGGVSGDSYCFERIGDRFLVGLLDGMGAGERAGKSSESAIELIECFYRAGFDSQSALSGVNRFLKLPSDERFSAVDVAVCELDSGRLDIIKLGSPPCYIKTCDTVLCVEGSALPIGVLDEMRPSVICKNLYPEQTLILVTDGVSDCFEGDELAQFINDLKGLNPKNVASDILGRALQLCGENPKDDMTVVAFRLFENGNYKIECE